MLSIAGDLMEIKPHTWCRNAGPSLPLLTVLAGEACGALVAFVIGVSSPEPLHFTQAPDGNILLIARATAVIRHLCVSREQTVQETQLETRCALVTTANRINDCAEHGGACEWAPRWRREHARLILYPVH